MFELEEINHYDKYYDRIEYLAKRIMKVRNSWITDDWLIKYFTNRWSKP